jgi:glucose-6-phosphate isomerase
MDASELWNRYWQNLCRVDSLDLTLDISRMHFDERFLTSMEPAVQRAFADMDALESGAIANPDEKRMVGHFWLRAPQTADQIAAIVAAQSAETIYLILEHLSSNGRAKMARSTDPGVQMFSRI